MLILYKMSKKIIFLCLFLSIFLIFFGIYKKTDRSVPINAQERARQNVEEGRGASIKGLLGKSKKTSYEFSTSNPMWRATLETLDFLPLSTVDYSGGIVITDWYSDGKNNESLKITVRFLGNEIASNNLKIIVHQKKCVGIDQCNIKELKSTIKQELTGSILRKAAQLELDSKNKKK